MNVGELIKYLLRFETNAKVFVNGVIDIDDENQKRVLTEVRNIKGEEHESFNDGKKFVRIIF